MELFQITALFYPLTLQDSNTNNQEIQGIIEPSPIQYSFDTLGWKIVGVLLILLIAWLSFKAYKRYQKSAYKRNAIDFLSNLEKKPNDLSFEIISQELKKVALISYGREAVASLHGVLWLTFLQEKGKNTPFLNFKDDIESVMYSDNNLDNTKTLEIVKISKKWIKTHA